MTNKIWPELILEEWQDTLATVHMWMQIIGKVSPVHFWWGGFDHAVTRFSGRPAPPRTDGKMNQEAYSHEVISHGFWPGGNGFQAAFYSYAAPEPPGYSEAKVTPAAAFYS